MGIIEFLKFIFFGSNTKTVKNKLYDASYIQEYLEHCCEGNQLGDPKYNIYNLDPHLELSDINNAPKFYKDSSTDFTVYSNNIRVRSDYSYELEFLFNKQGYMKNINFSSEYKYGIFITIFALGTVLFYFFDINVTLKNAISAVVLLILFRIYNRYLFVQEYRKFIINFTYKMAHFIENTDKE